MRHLNATFAIGSLLFTSTAFSFQSYVIAVVPDPTESFVKSALKNVFVVNPRYTSEDVKYGTDIFWSLNSFGTKNVNVLSVIEDGTETTEDLLKAIASVPRFDTSLVMFPFACLKKPLHFSLCLLAIKATILTLYAPQNAHPLTLSPWPRSVRILNPLTKAQATAKRFRLRHLHTLEACLTHATSTGPHV
jgi:hypothetical protein